VTATWAAFGVAVVVSLSASALLVLRLERLGARWRLTESLLGLLTALAADAPEITTAVSALAQGRHDIGVGVVLGSNVFNLAALLGLGAVVAGRIELDRRVVALEGIGALWLAVCCVSTTSGAVAPSVALVAALAVFVPYVALAALTPAARARLPLRGRAQDALLPAIAAEDHDIETGRPHPSPGGRGDGWVVLGATLVVVGASLAMERSAVRLGAQLSLSPVVVGAVVLAAVTSLPNLVAAVYLARRGRGAATLSEAMNSNSINAVVGFLIPAAIIGLPALSAGSKSVGTWYLGLTVACLAWAWLRRGLGRVAGAAVIGAYLLFVATLRP